MYFRMLHDEAGGKVAYLLADLDAGEAVAIDPQPADLAVVRALLAEHRLRLRWLLHTGAARPPANGRAGDALQALEAAPAHARERPELLSFGGEHLRILPTPGYTPEGVSYQWRDRVFCGDLLGTGDSASSGAPPDPDALWDSVTRVLFSLPPETLLFRRCARQGRVVSTVATERRWHPWFGALSRDAFIARVGRLRASVGHA